MGFIRDGIKKLAAAPDEPEQQIDVTQLSESDFDEVISLLADSEYVFGAEMLLDRAGRLAEPALLRAMRSGVLFNADRRAAMYKSPLQIVGQALLAIDSTGWLDCIPERVLTEDSTMSMTCRMFLGHLGGADEFELMRRIIRTPGRPYRTLGGDLLNGIRQRLEAKPEDKAVFRPLMDDLWAFSLRDDGDRNAPGLLIMLDRDATLSRVRSELFVSPEKAGLKPLVLWSSSLVRNHVRLDAQEVERLMQAAEALRNHDLSHLVSRLMARLLSLGALAKSQKVRSIIDAGLAAPDDGPDGWFLAHAFWHNIDFESPPIDWVSEDVPETVHHYRDLARLTGEILNGGITQYFFNSSGDRARFALDALKVIGDKIGHAILVDAMRAFGPSGPSPDRVERARQLDAMLPDYDTDEAEEAPEPPNPFAGIDDRWVKHVSMHQRLTLDYMINHVGIFGFRD